MNLPRLLIVDDEASVRESLKFVFNKGFSLTEANSLETAIAKVKETRPAVVLLDVLMPRTDGIEVLRQIKAIHPSCEVIMLTALSNRQVAAKAIDCGAFDLVGKPFDVVDLLAKVNSALAKATVEEKAALPET
jgi:DNA-binding NtrC family response regulator